MGIALVLVILGIAVVLLVTEWIPMEATALLTLGALALSGLVTPAQALGGFSNAAVITVWAVFILSGALGRTGVAGRIGNHVLRLAGSGETRLVAVIMLSGGLLSAVMNNVAVAAMMLPVIMDISRRTGIAPSRVLLPLAYGSLLGGLTTLIGTPPNILVSDALRDAGLRPFGFFDFTPVGLCILGVGTAFMVLFGRRLLGWRDVAVESSLAGDLDLREQYSLRERLFQLALPADSPLAGHTLEEARLGRMLGLQVLGIGRPGRNLLAPAPGERLAAGDRLLVQGRLERKEALAGWSAVSLDESAAGVDLLLTTGSTALATLAPTPALAGRTMAEAEFHSRLGVHVLALRHPKGPLLFSPALETLASGDHLLVHGPATAVARLSDAREFSSVEALDRAKLEKEFGLSGRLQVGRIDAGSPLAGRPLEEAALASVPGVRLLGVIRDGAALEGSDPEPTLAAGDRLLVLATRETFDTLRAIEDLRVERELPRDEELLESDRVGMVEAVLAPRSTLAGRPVAELRLRDQYGLSLLAVWRGGRAIRSNLGELTIQHGDALLLYGPRERLRALGEVPEFIVLTAAAQETPRSEKAWVAAAIMIGVVGAAVSGLAPISIAAVVGAALTVVTRCLTMVEAHRAIEWKAVFLIAGLLPLGEALDATGAARLLADGVVGTVGEFGPATVMAALMLITFVATTVIPTAALVLLMAPIVLNTAAELGLSPHALMMAVAMAASSSFTSPVSHPANVLVMGPGGYRFADYLRVGGALTAVVFVVTMVVLPWFWPLAAR